MNAKWKRIAACVLACSAALSVFASCGRDLGDLTEPSEAEADKPRESILITMNVDEFESLIQNFGGSLPMMTVTDAAAPTQPASQTPSAPLSATVPQLSDTPNAPATTAATQAANPLNYSKEELLTYFNSCANKIKQNKPGITRDELNTITDIKLSNNLANSLVGLVKGQLVSDQVETTTVQKGQPCNDLVSPEGKDYVSALTIADIENITVAAAGDGYTITVTMPEAVNPTRGGTYDKIFQYITVDDVMNTYVPKIGATVAREDVSVKYKACTATLTVDAAGNATNYKTYVTCAMSLKNGSIKKGVTIQSDVDATVTINAEFKNFVW